MPDRNRADDSDIIDRETEMPTPSQGSASGGDLAREVGQRDEDKTATGESDQVTRVQKSDKPAEGASSSFARKDGGTER